MHPHPVDPLLASETITTIRLLSVDAVEEAGSGHPGTPMEAAAIGYLLFTRHLRFNPANPDWPGRDRFILSCGHASMLLYSLLHLCGYDLSLEDLRRFRQFGSRTPGHPEFGIVPGCETTTGPLGQGAAVAVGMAMGLRTLAKELDAGLFDSKVFVLCSDGDMMEGVSSEAASLAGHLSLPNLCCIYLDNRITIEGEADLAFSEDVGTRYLAYGWQVLRVEGDNLREIDAALDAARRSARPTLIVARTHIAIGAPSKQDSHEAHGAPLGREEVRQLKLLAGRSPDESFVVPESVRRHLEFLPRLGEELERSWQVALSNFRRGADKKQLEVLGMVEGRIPEFHSELPRFASGDGPMATRSASGKVLAALGARLPLLLGGSADLAPSNNTKLPGENSYSREAPGRILHFGVREHAMGAILNGLSHVPGLIPFGGTFLIFSDYMRPPMRLANLMELAPIYVFTHDSIALGADGPTHQPVEQLAGLRALPGLRVIRPCDANEVREAWVLAVENRRRPTALVLSRQNLPVLERTSFGSEEGVRHGGYVLAREAGPLELILIATGAEVHPALEAKYQLEQQGIGTRLVSLPCWEIFDEQTVFYREQVLPSTCRARIAIEAASPLGWERYLGFEGRMLGMEGFGASAPGQVLYEHYGFTAAGILEKALRLLRAG